MLGIIPTAGWGFDWGNGPAWDSVFGKVSVMWKRENDKIIFNLEYPNPAKGKLVLKNGVETDAVSGEYIIKHNN